MQPPWLIGYVFPAIGGADAQIQRFKDIADRLEKPLQIVVEHDKYGRSAIISDIMSRLDDGPDVVASMVPRVIIKNDDLANIILMVDELCVVARSVELSKLLFELNSSVVEAAAVHPAIGCANFRNVIAGNIVQNAAKLAGSVTPKNIQRMESSRKKSIALVSDVIAVFDRHKATSIDSAVEFLLEGAYEHKRSKRDNFRKEVDRAIENLFLRDEISQFIEENLSLFSKSPKGR